MVGANFDGPKPFQTGMLGAMVWVRSTYLAWAKTSSYSFHSPGGLAAGACRRSQGRDMLKTLAATRPAKEEREETLFMARPFAGFPQESAAFDALS
jgi:hypothetical protein